MCYHLCVFQSGFVLSFLFLSVLANASYGSPPLRSPPSGAQMFSLPLFTIWFFLFGAAADRGCG